MEAFRAGAYDFDGTGVGGEEELALSRYACRDRFQTEHLPSNLEVKRRIACSTNIA